MSINQEQLDDLTKYCNSIQDSKSLTKEEERELSIKIKAGDNDALNKLVVANLMYVVRIAKRFSWSNLPILDLISEGNLALMHAAKKFDAKVGTKFITYADRWIRQRIREYIENSHITTEITGMDEYIHNDESSYELIDYETENEIHTTNSRESAITELMGCLDEREYQILEEYFGLNGKDSRTLDEIGKEMGLTQERVRQIKDVGIEKMQLKAISSSNYAEFKELY